MQMHNNGSQPIIVNASGHAASTQRPARALRQRLRRRLRGHDSHTLNKLFNDAGFRPFRVY